jgi:hypothetical protein
VLGTPPAFILSQDQTLQLFETFFKGPALTSHYLVFNEQTVLPAVPLRDLLTYFLLLALSTLNIFLNTFRFAQGLTNLLFLTCFVNPEHFPQTLSVSLRDLLTYFFLLALSTAFVFFRSGPAASPLLSEATDHPPLQPLKSGSRQRRTPSRSPGLELQIPLFSGLFSSGRNSR